MKEGHKLYVTAHYSFSYDDSMWNHLTQFDILTQFFEHRNNLEGFVEDEEGPRVEENSEVSILIDDLHKGFEDRNIPGVVEKYLLKFEMYEILSEYHSPLEGEALEYKEELLNAANYGK